MSRLRASRLPVPAGTIPTGMPVPASSAHTSRTVPSPPHTMTRSAPSTEACSACPVPESSTVVRCQDGLLPAGLAGDAGDGGLEGLDVLDLDRVEDDGEPLARRHHLGQRLRLHGVAARLRVEEGQPEQHERRAEQGAADDVGGVVAAEQDPVQRHDDGDQHHRVAEQLPDAAAPHQHREQHQHDAGEGDDRRGVTRGERPAVEQVDRRLPLRAVAADHDLERRRRPPARQHHDHGEQGGPAVVLHEHRDGQDRREDDHADGVEQVLDDAQHLAQAGVVDRPPLGAAAAVVEIDQPVPPLVDRHGEQPHHGQTRHRQGDLDGPGSVEQARSSSAACGPS